MPNFLWGRPILLDRPPEHPEPVAAGSTLTEPYDLLKDLRLRIASRHIGGCLFREPFFS